eukprot:362044-Chlamydomonas_euryale.AAC.3
MLNPQWGEALSHLFIFVVCAVSVSAMRADAAGGATGVATTFDSRTVRGRVLPDCFCGGGPHERSAARRPSSVQNVECCCLPSPSARPPLCPSLPVCPFIPAQPISHQTGPSDAPSSRWPLPAAAAARRLPFIAAAAAPAVLPVGARTRYIRTARRHRPLCASRLTARGGPACGHPPGPPFASLLRPPALRATDSQTKGSPSDASKALPPLAPPPPRQPGTRWLLSRDGVAKLVEARSARSHLAGRPIGRSARRTDGRAFGTAEACQLLADGQRRSVSQTAGHTVRARGRDRRRTTTCANARRRRSRGRRRARGEVKLTGAGACARAVA